MSLRSLSNSLRLADVGVNDLIANRVEEPACGEGPPRHQWNQAIDNDSGLTQVHATLAYVSPAHFKPIDPEKVLQETSKQRERAISFIRRNKEISSSKCTRATEAARNAPSPRLQEQHNAHRALVDLCCGVVRKEEMARVEEWLRNASVAQRKKYAALFASLRQSFLAGQDSIWRENVRAASQASMQSRTGSSKALKDGRDASITSSLSSSLSSSQTSGGSYRLPGLSLPQDPQAEKVSVYLQLIAAQHRAMRLLISRVKDTYGAHPADPSGFISLGGLTMEGEAGNISLPITSSQTLLELAHSCIVPIAKSLPKAALDKGAEVTRSRPSQNKAWVSVRKLQNLVNSDAFRTFKGLPSVLLSQTTTAARDERGWSWLSADRGYRQPADRGTAQRVSFAIDSAIGKQAAAELGRQAKCFAPHAAGGLANTRNMGVKRAYDPLLLDQGWRRLRQRARGALGLQLERAVHRLQAGDGGGGDVTADTDRSLHVNAHANVFSGLQHTDMALEARRWQSVDLLRGLAAHSVAAPAPSSTRYPASQSPVTGYPESRPSTRYSLPRAQAPGAGSGEAEGDAIGWSEGHSGGLRRREKDLLDTLFTVLADAGLLLHHHDPEVAVEVAAVEEALRASSFAMPVIQAAIPRPDILPMPRLATATGMLSQGPDLSRASTAAAAAARAGRIGSGGGIDGMQPLVRVINVLVSADAHMDSFASALRLLSNGVCKPLPKSVTCHYSLPGKSGDRVDGADPKDSDRDHPKHQAHASHQEARGSHQGAEGWDRRLGHISGFSKQAGDRAGACYTETFETRKRHGGSRSKEVLSLEIRDRD